MKALAVAALLLAAPCAAQLRGAWWHDVHMNFVVAQPIAVGSDLGLLLIIDNNLSFVFDRGTAQQLRVHAVAWHGYGPASFRGEEMLCRRWMQDAFQFSESAGFVWSPTNFTIGNLVSCNRPYAVTVWWWYPTWHQPSPTASAVIVTAVGGW